MSRLHTTSAGFYCWLDFHENQKNGSRDPLDATAAHFKALTLIHTHKKMVPAAERVAASQLAAQVARAELEARPSELRGSLTQAQGDKGAGKQQIRGSGGGNKGAGGAPSRQSDCLHSQGLITFQQCTQIRLSKFKGIFIIWHTCNIEIYNWQVYYICVLFLTCCISLVSIMLG